MKLPGEESFGPRQTQAVVRPIADPGGSGLGDALTRVGDGIENIGLKRKAQTDRLEIVRAKSAWLTSKAQAYDAFKHDDDYETIEDRYTQRIDESAGNVSEMISDPTARAMFEEEIALDRELGIIKSRDLAQLRGRDVELARFKESITALKDASIMGDIATRSSIAETVDDYIESLRERDYISAEQAVDMRKDVASDYAISLLKLKEPRDQIEMLKTDPLMLELPEDVRQGLIIQADEASVLGESQGAADDILAETTDRQTALAEVAKIQDPEVRKAARSEVVSRLNQQKTADAEYQRGIADDFINGMVEGQSLTSQRRMNPLKWDQLTGETKAALISMESSGEKSRTTNDAAYTEVSNMLRAGKLGDARDFVRQNYGQFSSSDYRKLLDMTDDPIAREGFLSDTARIKQFTEENNLNADEHGRMLRDYEGFLNRYRGQNDGKEPGSSEKQSFLDGLLIEHSPGFLGFGDSSVVDIEDPAERRESLRMLEEARRAFSARYGREPTQKDLQRMYREANK